MDHYLKIPESISAWIITCILFVFGALTGYAGILFKKNRLTRIDHELDRSVLFCPFCCCHQYF